MALRSVVPLLGTFQWVAGIALSLLAVRRSGEHAGSGAWPRFLSRVSLVLFVLAGIVLVLSFMPSAANAIARALSSFGAPPADAWTAQRALIVAWAALAVAALWNLVLGINRRRRNAAAELRRRTERAMDHRSTPSSTPQEGGETGR